MKQRILLDKFEELRRSIRRLCPDPIVAREATRLLNKSELLIIDSFSQVERSTRVGTVPIDSLNS